MRTALKAVIFDMDGVLINSEPLWRKAMIEGFAGAGMNLSEDDCRKTMGNRFPEVIAYWLNYYQITSLNPLTLEKTVMAILFDLIESEGAVIPGIPELFDFCGSNNLKTGLATSSSEDLMQRVLKKLDLGRQLQATVSAERMKYGKPHPEVFLHCAEMLDVLPAHCLVIEDSLNGVIAAKAAQMQVIAVPDEAHRLVPKFALADYNLNSMHEVLALFKTLF